MLTCVDLFTRWQQIMPILCTTYEEATGAVFDGWVGVFECPAVVTTNLSPFSTRHSQS